LTEPARSNAGRSNAWGPVTAFGVAVAVITCLIDQAAKGWLLLAADLGSHSRSVTPFFNLVLVWNTGISYGLFAQQGPIGRWALLVFKVAAVAFLWVWLARSSSRLTGLALGLIIGGAVGNAVDRVHWPGVMDFADLHLGNLHWYVFNLADTAIVAGVVALLYESLRGSSAAKAP
jgi:signal peptidase II